MSSATEELERRRRVEQLGQDISRHLEAIRRLYKDEVLITLIVRAPADPTGRRDTVLTDDPDPLKAVEAFRLAITGEGRGFDFHRINPAPP